MIEIRDKRNCSGCHGCYSICPKMCISMESDNEGFKYPVVDKKSCINCGLCEKVCPIIQEINIVDDIIAYACKNKDLETRLSSSSGGVFYILAEYVIKNKGVVFGAKFNKNLEVEHDWSKTLEGCSKFKGSKYIQSNINSNYKKAKEFLEEGTLVLFSGTPCQISGLKKFLRKEYKNLICVDIACHGCPSPLVFKKYKEVLEKEFNSKINKFSFRNKKNGWKSYKISINFDNGEEKVEQAQHNIYIKGFLQDLYLRPSCYECKFKKPYTHADITLADYWGVQNIHPKIDDDKGVSLVLINSENGKDIFSKISNNLDILKTDLNYAMNNNVCIISPVKYNKKREKFFNEIQSKDIESLIEKNIRISLMKKVNIKIYSIISKIKSKVTNN